MFLDKKTVLFLVKFGLIFSVLHFLVWSLPLTFLENWIALLQANLFHLPLNENMIFLSEQRILINPSCTGLISISILAAIIFSLSRPEIKQKIKIFLAAAAIMFVLNLIRIYFVLWIGINFGENLIGIVHEISWMTTALFIIALWYYFTKKITKVKEFNELLYVFFMSLSAETGINIPFSLSNLKPLKAKALCLKEYFFRYFSTRNK